MYPEGCRLMMMQDLALASAKVRHVLCGRVVLAAHVPRIRTNAKVGQSGGLHAEGAISY